MPFDGAEFHARREYPRRATPSGRGLGFLVFVLAIGMLVTPFSMAAFIDVVRYIWGK